MLVLMTAPPAFGIDCPSPFCTKADVLLQMSGIPFERQASDPRQGPKKKLPVLRDGEELVADTFFIRKHLEEKRGVNFPEGEGARTELLTKTIEEHLYWAQVRFRWEDHPTKVRDGFFGSVPIVLRQFVFNMVRKQVTQALWGQGTGRHTREEVLALAEPSWRAVTSELGEAPFFGGASPIVADASLYGLVSNILAPDLPTPLADQVRTFPALVAHADRMAERFPLGSTAETRRAA